MRIDMLTKKVSQDLIEYVFDVAYLTLVFAAFTQYRRGSCSPNAASPTPTTGRR